MTQTLNQYLAPTLFAVAAALFVITGVEYLKMGSAPSHQMQVWRFGSIYRHAVERVEVGFHRVSRSIGLGANTDEPGKLSRMAVISHRGESYQILGIKTGTALSERRVLVRDMGNHRIGAFAAGERIFGGARIERITPETVQIVVEAPQRREIRLNSLHR